MKVHVRSFRHVIPLCLAAMVSMLPGAGQAEHPSLGKWNSLNHAAAPEGAMMMTGDKHHILDEFHGKVVVLNLWASWCGPCIEEMPSLDNLEKSLSNRGLIVIPLSVEKDDSYETLRRFLDKNGIALPNLAIDDSHSFARKLMISGLPITYLVGRDGTLRYELLGNVDWMDKEQKDKIEELLSERE